MDLGLSGRTALVGGASAGLGRASAAALAAEGCRLAIWSRSADRLERVADELRSRHGSEVTTIADDATDPGAAARVADAARAALGTVDILVLNAGGPPPVAAMATDAAGWDLAFQLLAKTPIELATLLLPGMRERGWGRVVALVSTATRLPIPELVYSTGGRSALVAWLKTISAEVAADGVTVNGILPGRLDTDRIRLLDRHRAEATGTSVEAVRAAHLAAIPAGRYGRPEELGSLVAWLCSEPASYQTGTFTALDGGLLRGLP